MDRESPFGPDNAFSIDSPSKCPVCGPSALETIPSVGPVCVDCGTVTTTASENLRLTATDEQPDQDETWTEHYTVTNSTEQRMAESLDVLETIAQRLNLGREARKQAAEVYTEAALSNLPDGRPTELTVGAAIAHGTRASDEPRPSGCVAEAATVDRDSLHRVSKLLSQELGRPIQFCPPEDYLAYLGKELQLDTSAIIEAEQMLSGIDGSVLAGKDPVGFAGAVLYLVAGGDVTQREIARTAGITTETLRVRVRDCRATEETQ